MRTLSHQLLINYQQQRAKKIFHPMQKMHANGYIKKRGIKENMAKLKAFNQVAADSLKRGSMAGNLIEKLQMFFYFGNLCLCFLYRGWS